MSVMPMALIAIFMHKLYTGIRSRGAGGGTKVRAFSMNVFFTKCSQFIATVL